MSGFPIYCILQDKLFNSDFDKYNSGTLFDFYTDGKLYPPPRCVKALGPFPSGMQGIINDYNTPENTILCLKYV